MAGFARQRTLDQPLNGAVALPAGELARLRAHARAAYPDECCGVLLGRAGERVQVASLHPARNRHRPRARDRYEIHPGDLLRLDRAARRDGLAIVGFYHSHPDHPPQPSVTDAAQAWPGYVYLIVAVAGGAPGELKAWSYDAGSRQFHEQPIETLAPGPCRLQAAPSEGTTRR